MRPVCALAELTARFAEIITKATPLGTAPTMPDAGVFNELDGQHYTLWTEAKRKHVEKTRQLATYRLASLETSHRARLALLGEQPKDKVMLITDGLWARDDTKALKRWKDSLPPDTLRVIKIGADANPQLKGADVFIAEDVLAALDGWLEGGAEW